LILIPGELLMFNSEQEAQYKLSLTFLSKRLDDIYKQADDNSAKNAVCLLLDVTLKRDKAFLESMANIVLPGDDYTRIRAIYAAFHDLVNLKDPNSTFLKGITSVGANTRTAEDTSKLQQHIADTLKTDLGQWLNQKYVANEVNPQVITKLLMHHSRSILEESHTHTASKTL